MENAEPQRTYSGAPLASGDKYDVFISFRIKDNHANAIGGLFRELQTLNYRVFYYPDSNQAGDFRERALKAIRDSRCMILCCGDEGLGEDRWWQPAPEPHIFQGVSQNRFNETQWEIFEAIQRNGGVSGVTSGNDLSYPIIPILVPGSVKQTSLDYVPGFPSFVRTTGVATFVEKHGYRAALAELQTMLANSGIHPTGKPKPLEIKSEDKPLPPPVLEKLTAWERAYVEGALSGWVQGRGVASEAGESARAGAFGFKAARFMQLEAHEVGSADSALAGDVSKPAFHWLLAAEAHAPYVLCGGAGAGKTCTLSMAATAMAAALDPELRRQCEALKAPAPVLEWGEGLNTVPVFMRAQRIADALNAGADPSGAVFSAIATRMSSDKGVGADVVRARMLERPYALIVDELDRLSHDDEMHVLQALADVHALFAGRGRPLKVLGGGRQMFGERVEQIVDVLLRPPSDAQRETFISAFAEGWTGDTAACLQTIRGAVQGLRRHLSTATGSPDSEAFDTPLLLNALCWGMLHAQSGGKASAGQEADLRRDLDLQRCSTLVQLCDTLSDLLIQDAVTRARGAKPTVEDVARALEALAFHGIGGGELEVARARQVASDALGRDATSVLQFIENKTGLVERVELGPRRTLYRLKRLFGEYFAARHIARAEEGHAFLPQDAQIAARHWRSVLAFATATLFADPAHTARGERLLSALRDRIDAAVTPAQKADWFACLAACLGALAPLPDRESPTHQFAIDAAIDTIAAASAWTPQQRAEALNGLAAAVSRVSTQDTRAAINDLFKRALDLRDHWIDLKGFRHPSGAKEELRVAGLPVLSAHFHEFYQNDQWVKVQIGEAATPLDRDLQAYIHALPGAPVAFVTFEEAVAYCLWLSERLQGQLAGDVLRLPTRSEWEALSGCLAGDNDYVWGADDPGVGEAARVNWRGAQIGAPTPPGAFAAYGARDLYDFNTNVAVWVLADRGPGEQIWPPQRTGAYCAVMGGHFASQLHGVTGSGNSLRSPPEERRRERGMRLVRTRRVTGWAVK